MDFLNRFRVTSEGWQQSQRRPLAFVAGVALVAVATARVSLSQPATPQRGQVIENSLGMKLVVIPAGEFEMGSNEGEEDEQPIHRVRITKPFWMGQTEVTKGQFERVLGTTPWRGKLFFKIGPTMAASYVSWNDAVEFCRKLTEIERRAGRLSAAQAYRLPTEAEWEYACRAGTKTRWSFGDDESRLGEYAWVNFGTAVSGGELYAHEVGQKKPNPWGLFDMHGNVLEWCSDLYDSDYYRTSPAVDPKGPASAGSFRVMRGGSWNFGPVACRSADRYANATSAVGDSHGFRVVLSVE
jgi:formylglycine-generating enzyme required for sulfatase activity